MKWTEEALNSFVNSNSLAILLFKSHGCGVCHAQMDRVEALANRMDVPLMAVEMSENRHLASSQMVLGVPFTKVFKDGKEVLKQGAYLDYGRLEEVLEILKESI